MAPNDEDDAEGRPTPKESGSFQIATHAGGALVTRLAAAVLDLRRSAIRRRSANPLFRDPLCAAACDHTADTLEELAEDVREILPLLADPEKRPTLVADLWELRREAETMLASLGKGPKGEPY